MDKQYCKYHPDQLAPWVCTDCRLHLCQVCVGPVETAPQCAICGQTMQRLSVQNTIEPFWQRLSSFFVFPASFPTILYLMIFAAISSFISIGIPGLVLGLVVYFLFINYAYTVLDLTSHGELDELPAGMRGFFYRPENAVKQLLMFIVLVGFNFFMFDIGGFGGFQLSALLSLIVFPAISLQLVKHQSLLKMFSYSEVKHTFLIMGRDYWLLCLFLVLLFLGAEALLSILPASASSNMNFAIEHFVVFYFLLIAFSMIGHSFYQYYEALGLEVSRYNDSCFQGEGPADQGTSARQISLLIKEGYLDEAMQRLDLEIKHNPADLNAWQRYFRLILLKGQNDVLQEFSQDYINYLMHQDKEVEAMSVFLETTRVIPDFRPKSGAQALALAGRLRSHGHAGLALSLLNNMHKHYRGYEGVAKAYMLAAQILCEQFGEDLKARKILKFIIKKYPQSRYAQEAADYLKVVDQLAVR